MCIRYTIKESYRIDLRKIKILSSFYCWEVDFECGFCIQYHPLCAISDKLRILCKIFNIDVSCLTIENFSWFTFIFSDILQNLFFINIAYIRICFIRKWWWDCEIYLLNQRYYDLGTFFFGQFIRKFYWELSKEVKSVLSVTRKLLIYYTESSFKRALLKCWWMKSIWNVIAKEKKPTGVSFIQGPPNVHECDIQTVHNILHHGITILVVFKNGFITWYFNTLIF